MDVRRNHLTDFSLGAARRAPLPGAEAAWLEGRLRPEPLASEQVLCEAEGACGALWLLDDAVTARIAQDDRGHAFEIGVDGAGSIVCAWMLESGWLSPWQVAVRRGGMARALLRRDAEQLSEMAPIFYSRCQATIQAEVHQLAAQFALSRRRTARSLLAERLAGYFAAFGENSIPITHIALARRLNLRRATVTLALQELEGSHAIRAYRARIELKDAARLRALANED